MSLIFTLITSLLGSITAIVLAFYVSSQGLKDKIKRSYFFLHRKNNFVQEVVEVVIRKNMRHIKILKKYLKK